MIAALTIAAVETCPVQATLVVHDARRLVILVALYLVTRGFDPEGADRVQLLDAVVQLLEYEHATGVDLRELVRDLGASESGTEQEAFYAGDDLPGESEASGGGGVVNQGVEDETVEEAAEVLDDAEIASEDDLGSKRAGLDETELGEADLDRVEVDEGGVHEGEVNEMEADGVEGVGGDGVEVHEREMQNVEADVVAVDKDEVAQGGRCVVDRGDGLAVKSSDTVLEYLRDIGLEMCEVVKNDLNNLVGLLPAPVAKQVRRAAGTTGNIAVKVVVPVAEQAERYTRVVRRAAMKSAKQLVVHVKRVMPKVARGLGHVVSKTREGVSEAFRMVLKSEAETETTESE